MPDERRTLLLSIRPRFAELILGGDKTVELRRVPPKVQDGDLVLLYASSPVRELIGTCTVAGLDVASAAEIWDRHGARAGVTRDEFDAYFAGASRAVGISVRDPRRVRQPRTLDEIRRRIPGFVVPQSYTYMTADNLGRMGIELEEATPAGPANLVTVNGCSSALDQWRGPGLARLAELEAVHANLTGSGSGRRWGTTQLNRSLFLALVAQFQSFCRDLHDEAVAVHTTAANPAQQQTLEVLMVQGRRLDTHNPRRSTLGHDFGRLGFNLLDAMKAAQPSAGDQLRALDLLVDYRNAIGHGDESKIAGFEAAGEIKATKRSYQQYRRALDGLAITMDDVVADELSRALGVERPW